MYGLGMVAIGGNGGGDARGSDQAGERENGFHLHRNFSLWNHGRMQAPFLPRSPERPLNGGWPHARARVWSRRMCFQGLSARP
jgi:hypothetical protein